MMLDFEFSLLFLELQREHGVPQETLGRLRARSDGREERTDLLPTCPRLHRVHI